MFYVAYTQNADYDGTHSDVLLGVWNREPTIEDLLEAGIAMGEDSERTFDKMVSDGDLGHFRASVCNGEKVLCISRMAGDHLVDEIRFIVRGPNEEEEEMNAGVLE